MKQGVWEKEYRNVDNLWGFNPNNMMLTYINLVSKSGKVLDIGIGEGRNAFFLPDKGMR